MEIAVQVQKCPSYTSSIKYTFLTGSNLRRTIFFQFSNRWVIYMSHRYESHCLILGHHLSSICYKIILKLWFENKIKNFQKFQISKNESAKMRFVISRKNSLFILLLILLILGGIKFKDRMFKIGFVYHLFTLNPIHPDNFTPVLWIGL